jgi:hypothetical protein
MGVDVMIAGHTHKLSVRQGPEGGLYINPGSVRMIVLINDLDFCALSRPLGLTRILRRIVSPMAGNGLCNDQ